MSTNGRPTLLLALTPLAERSVEPLLFDAEAPVDLVGSAAEADELDRLSDDAHADAVLVSPQLAGITSGHLARVRAKGIAVVGLALDDLERQQLESLGAERTIGDDATADQLVAAIREPAARDDRQDRPASPKRSTDEGRAVVAVVGSKGAPGSSELAVSLAALASNNWPVLLVELDALGGSLDLRLTADPDDGSVLGLVRAVRDGGEDVRDLLERWVIGSPGWPPVLLGAPSGNGAVVELGRPGAVADAIGAVARLWPAVICDIGFALDDADAAAARVHREAIVSADAVVLVIGAREPQLRHGVVQLDILLDDLAVPRERIRVVVNGLGAPGSPNRRSIEQTVLAALAERRLTADAWLPWDARGARRAEHRGLPLAQARRRGGYARVLRSLLNDLFLPAPDPIPQERKRPLTTATADRQPRPREEVALPWRSTN